MTYKKHLNIEIEGQDNIGVIALGDAPINKDNLKYTEWVYTRVNEKLIVPLVEHFDNEIEVMQVCVVSLTPIRVNCKVRILDCDDIEECSIEEVVLSETWVY